MKKKVFIILFLNIFFLSKNSFAQSKSVVDSFNHILFRNIDDTFSVNAYLGLANEFYLESPSKAEEVCLKAKSLSEKINFTGGLSNSLAWLAYLYEQEGKIDTALLYYRKSLSLSIKLKYEKDEATILSNMGAIFKDQGKIDSALAYDNRSLRIRKKLNDKDGIATVFNNIGLIYFNQGKIPDALDYYLKALKLEEEIKNDDGISTALQNIAFVYKDQKEYDEAMNYLLKSLSIRTRMKDKYGMGYALNAIGALFQDEKLPDSALVYHEQALAVRKEIDDAQGVAYSLKNIGVAYKELKDFSNAKSNLQNSVNAFEKLNDPWGIAASSNLLGEVLLKTNDLTSSEKYLMRSLKLAQGLGYPADIRNAAGNLSQLYRQKNDFKQALEFNDLFIQMRDSVFNIDNRKSAIRAQYRKEYEQKEVANKIEQEKKDALKEAEIKRKNLLLSVFVFIISLTVGFLFIVIRQRNKISKARRRSDELLLNILPEEVADELKANGRTTAKDFSEVTVLFTDFKNFTAMSEKLSAQELVNEINYCYSAFDNIISKHNIEKIKTIGDSYMCAGGLPVANKTNAIDTVTAAIEIRDFMLKEKLKREAEGKPFFEIRIGLNTGSVVAGIVGIKKFAYDIWGDTVNIASRMESSGEAGKINISGSTYDLVKEKFICTHRGKIQAKNKGEIDMYFVA